MEVVGASTSGNVVEGNYVGLDANGTSNTGTANVYGIVVQSAIGTIIGGTTPAARNVISGNDYGVYLNGSDTSILEGNYIGTDPTGMTSLGNAYWGVRATQSDAKIGGITATPGAGAGNVISGNGGAGLIVFASGAGAPVTIEGNIIGLNAAGNAGLANGATGGTKTRAASMWKTARVG